MRREDKFVLSHRPYAVDLSTVRPRHPEDPKSGFFVADAVWFKRRYGVLAACIGELWDIQRPAPANAHDFLIRHDDGRYGGNCHARWDGANFWAAGQDPEENARFLELLRPMLAAYPVTPEGFDGWWVF